MPSCEPAELIENARFLDCCLPKGLQMAVLILLFGELVTMPSDATTLLNEAKCLDQCIPDGAKMSVLISLACQLVQQGGIGGGLPVYANNASAIAGGLSSGAFYRTGSDPDTVNVVH